MKNAGSAGIFFVWKSGGAGLTFGHDLDSPVVKTSWHRAMLILGQNTIQNGIAEVVSECQT